MKHQSIDHHHLIDEQLMSAKLISKKSNFPNQVTLVFLSKFKEIITLPTSLLKGEKKS